MVKLLTTSLANKSLVSMILEPSLTYKLQILTQVFTVCEGLKLFLLQAFAKSLNKCALLFLMRFVIMDTHRYTIENLADLAAYFRVGDRTLEMRTGSVDFWKNAKSFFNRILFYSFSKYTTSWSAQQKRDMCSLKTDKISRISRFRAIRKAYVMNT